MIGKTLNHFKVLDRLGKGGMGEVYVAEDSKLKRKVALKVLPEDVARDPVRLDRFQREAESIAALNHPNIVTIYSIEEADGVPFLTMELVDGETLIQLIPSNGLDVETFFRFSAPVAEALSAAHEKGIIHRDLKPGNIMVNQEGRVKVLDFGLAKLMRDDSDPSSSRMETHAQTEAGIVLGTMPYMSPEQIQGKKLDQRSDIFSLGIIFYEMITGRRPFHGDTSAELISSIMRDTPGPVSDLKPGTPEHLARIIRRCLTKDPRDRYQTARDVYNELRDSNATSESFSRSSSMASHDSRTARAEEGFWIAVLPFKCSGTNAELVALADGLSEEIVTGLSRFSYLRVISRRSSADRSSASKELGLRYLMEGTLRQSGTKLRLAVQLVDAISDAHLWAETYDRSYTPEALFELQDDLVPQIVSTVADMHGILPRSMSEIVRLKAADQLTPYEALLHSFGYNERFTPEALAEARECLERAVAQSPGNADCCAMLSLMYSNEYGHWDKQNPEFFEKALQFARTAIMLAPLHSLSYYALAQALFFQREFPASRTAAERAVSLNPMDGATAAFMGLLIAYSGEWERGCALAERGLQLNPNLPGMYNYTAWHEAYGRKDYRRALELALKLNTPDNFYQHAVLAMCYAQLGEMDAAHKSLRDMLAIKPDYAKVARQLHGKWIQPDLVEQLMDGLRKAGLEIANGEVHANTSAVRGSSGEQRADEGFWVAVLPFKYSGNNADLRTLAEGFSEEIVTGLSRFSYLKVIARSSSADPRTVNKELSARYVMEGSLRQAGNKLRLTIQLVDASSGAHLWAENYERIFNPEAVFELQDELVPRIVSTVADMHGVLPRSMSEVVRMKAADQLSPYEALLRSFGYFQRVTAEELAAARAGLELAVRKAPAYADAWAMLALLCAQEHGQGFNSQANSLTSGATAARRAIELSPSNHLAYFSLAQVLFFQKEFQSFRNAAERAVALNPMDGNSIAFVGELFTYAGDSERGMALADRAKQLNPNHPGWYWYADFYNAYWQGDYRGALGFALKADLPGHWGMHVAISASCGQLGERDAAIKSVQALLKLRPDFAATVRKDFEKWWEPEYVNRMIDGLHKAGLEIAGEITSTHDW